MDLKEYMFRERLRIEDMAALLDCSKPQIGLVRRGKRVSKKFARQIERVTEGKVTAQEVLNPSLHEDTSA